MANGRAKIWRTPRRAGLTLGALVLVVAAVTACQPVPAVLELTVTTAADGVDASPGNGVCEVHPGQGDCTLRAAITESNGYAGLDRITIAPGIHPVLSVAGSNENSNATGDLDVTGEVTIVGGGATVDAAGLDRVFDVRDGHLTIRQLTVTGGHPPRHEGSNLNSGGGAGIRAYGDLTLEDARVEGNVAEQSTEGVAIFASGATVTLTTTEVVDNSFLSTGGTATILLRDASVLSVSRSTVRSIDDEAIKSYRSNVVVADSTLNAPEAVDLYQATGVVVRSTLVGNDDTRFSALLRQSGGALHVGASILDQPAKDSQHLACLSASVSSLGWNVASDTTCGLTATGDQQGDPALLSPIGDNGGATQTYVPASNSPAIDRIPAGTASYCDGTPDQRGQARPVGAACDAGSVEGSVAPIESLHLTVDDASDAVDATPGDGVCASTAGTCTLRAAVMEANRYNDDAPAVADFIAIAPGVNPVLSIPGAGEDASATGDLDVLNALVIDGDGATIDGGGLDRVFQVVDHTATLRDLTVTGGSASGTGAAGNGGGILAPSLQLERATVRGNTATGAGGGIAGGEIDGVTVIDSDIDGNVAALSGGGISALELDVRRSLIRNNQAGRSGGGLGIDEPASARVEDSTITGNSATAGGAAISMSGVLTPGVVLVRSTVAANVGAPSLRVYSQVCTRGCYTWAAVLAEGSILVAPAGTAVCDAPVDGQRFNLAPDGTCGASVPGSGQLQPLADNGGPTLTHLPAAGSGALDALPSGTAGLCDVGAVDQRSVPRPQGSGCDPGAVEQ